MSKKTTHSRVVGKPASHPKQAAPSNAKLQSEIAALQKAVAALKHHHPAAKAKVHKAKKHHHVHHHKKRGLALGESVACCAAEALAASLRLAGHAVTDADVLVLHQLAGGDDEQGTSIADVLVAAAEYGLAGVRIQSAPYELVVADVSDDLAVLDLGDWVGEQLRGRNAAQLEPVGGLLMDRPLNHALILGVELPGGPHTLTVDPSGLVWSWGELYHLAELGAGPVEEAWAVTWQ